MKAIYPGSSFAKAAKVTFLNKKTHGTVFATHFPPQVTNRLVLFWPGDQLESIHASKEVLRLQDPQTLVQVLQRKFPGSHVAVITPSRLEAGFACFDHFLPGTTLEGDPIAYNVRSSVRQFRQINTSF